MIPISTIVEGHGEVKALPVLLRKMAEQWPAARQVNLLPPIRVQRDRFLNREKEFCRHLMLAAAKAGDSGWILLLLDADDDCPAELGPRIYQKAQKYIPHRRFSVVLANREFESWFIASAQALNGVRGFCFQSRKLVEAEVPRDAKGWIRKHMQDRTYNEILDQPAFTAKMDLYQALAGSRSFQKLHKEWLLHAVR